MRGLINKALKALATNAISATPNTMLFNQTGQPGISVPLYWNADDPPHRITDRRKIWWGKYVATHIELEIAQPWKDKIPTLLQ